MFPKLQNNIIYALDLDGVIIDSIDECFKICFSSKFFIFKKFIVIFEKKHNNSNRKIYIRIVLKNIILNFFFEQISIIIVQFKIRQSNLFF